jgi:hypothetical protein
MEEKLPSAGERRMSEGRGFLIAFHRAGQCCFKGGERKYSSDAPSRRPDFEDMMMLEFPTFREARA